MKKNYNLALLFNGQGVNKITNAQKMNNTQNIC